MEILLFIGFLAVLGVLFNFLLGYRKNNIIIDLDQCYTSLQEHTEAVIQELQRQNKEVESVGNRKLKIDGIVYILRERTVNVARVPLQRTILIPKKDSENIAKNRAERVFFLPCLLMIFNQSCF